MTGVNEFGTELADFRRRVGELKSARALPDTESQSTLDAALFELQHAADVLWPRYEELIAAGRRGTDQTDGREPQVLRALFQRLPVPVVLLDRDAVVRRMNTAASELFGIGAGYASGRSLTGSLAHSARAAFRSQVAAVARDEGSRSLRVHLLRPPYTEAPESRELRVTLSTLRTPGSQRGAVLAVFQLVAHTVPSVLSSGRSGHSGGGQTGPAPTLPEMTRHAELLDLVDDMAAELLVSASAEEAVGRAAAVLHRRFADWVVVDRRCVSGILRRSEVLAPAGAEEIREAVAAQNPAEVPVVIDAAERGAETLLVRPEDSEALGRDAMGAPVLARAEVSSLLCVPLVAPPGPPGREGRTGRRAEGPALGALTLLRSGGRNAIGLAEAGVVDRMARHLALALDRFERAGTETAESVAEDASESA
ncbi:MULTISPECIES: PAS domain-containing protein [unclassified Streptomyces]|uniref:PAS domain-containing protein n=1 Tax=unclassified Streptomyces TaxID=2593676 RepID=UPI002DD88ACD|nr:PAS domain-containing protein [Streptomyces sp. NBC_01775]WSB75847.1 PAS domain-containing protein [Streptomyces sp. NBC_01775]WSS44718.1 PAS domain-containing protein [Streptomyces sp. NBC_01187]